MKYSVVIPTLSRPEDLIKAVRSLTQQEPLPSQLIIVDQSPATTAKTEVVEICANYPSINLFYLHEQSIKSLPVAKQYSLSWVTGDIVCFFDDDVELEPLRLEEDEPDPSAHTHPERKPEPAEEHRQRQPEDQPKRNSRTQPGARGLEER